MNKNDIYQIDFTETFPTVLQHDPKMIALAKSMAVELLIVSGHMEDVLIYSRLDQLPLEDLVEPVAVCMSTELTCDGNTVRMMVEYCGDLNGGLDRSFWIREFSVFAEDLDGTEVMLYYDTLPSG